jgi:protein-S-isoprenylcysteine O-methyltransferase Ste14
VIPTLVVLDVLFLAAAFGGRTVLQWRRTHDSGWRLGTPHSAAEALARLAIVASGVALGVALLGPAANGLAVVGLVLCVAAIGFVLLAQVQMGDSWRIGVDPGERTALVRSGIYRRIRNPIYAGMVLFALGQLVARPNPLAATAAVLMVVGVEIQVRAVEEPYLVRTHGGQYREWASTAGRFVPVLGRV